MVVNTFGACGNARLTHTSPRMFTCCRWRLEYSVRIVLGGWEGGGGSGRRRRRRRKKKGAQEKQGRDFVGADALW